jgi:hypothetical protein
LAIIAQAILAILLASAIAATFVGRRANSSREPSPMFGATDFGIADDGERASSEQAA